MYDRTYVHGGRMQGAPTNDHPVFAAFSVLRALSQPAGSNPSPSALPSSSKKSKITTFASSSSGWAAKWRSSAASGSSSNHDEPSRPSTDGSAGSAARSDQCVRKPADEGALTIVVVHVSRQQGQSLLHVGQQLRLKAGADFLQRINEPGHFVGPDPPVQSQADRAWPSPPARRQACPAPSHYEGVAPRLLVSGSMTSDRFIGV